MNAIAWRNTTSSWSMSRTSERQYVQNVSMSRTSEHPFIARKAVVKSPKRQKSPRRRQIAQGAPNRPGGCLSCRPTVLSSRFFVFGNKVKWNPCFRYYRVDQKMVHFVRTKTIGKNAEMKCLNILLIAGKTRQRPGLTWHTGWSIIKCPYQRRTKLYTLPPACQNIWKTGVYKSPVISHLPKISQQGCIV